MKNISENNASEIAKLAYSIEVYIHNFIGRPELNDVYGGAVPLSTHAKAILQFAEKIQELMKEVA